MQLGSAMMIAAICGCTTFYTPRAQPQQTHRAIPVQARHNAVQKQEERRSDLRTIQQQLNQTEEVLRTIKSRLNNDPGD